MLRENASCHTYCFTSFIEFSTSFICRTRRSVQRTERILVIEVCWVRKRNRRTRKAERQNRLQYACCYMIAKDDEKRYVQAPTTDCKLFVAQRDLKCIEKT